jgi:pimeloyl-ACP methyl ester carboxylesterase
VTKAGLQVKHRPPECRSARNKEIGRLSRTCATRARLYLELARNLPRLPQETLSSGRQGQLLLAPVEQLCPQFIFQIVNLTAQRRLRYMQAFCGLTDVQFLGDSHKNVGRHPPEEALLADLRLVYPQRPNVKVESARHFVSFQQAAKDFEELSQTKLTMPVRTVGGEKANGALLGEQTKIVASDVTVIVLENTGHWVLEERPKETTDALMKFL